jgi:hypothetical protein
MGRRRRGRDWVRGRLERARAPRVAAVARTSHRGHLIALIFGGVATLLAASGVVEVLRWIHLLAWRLPPVRQRQNPRLVLGLVAGVVLVIGASAAAQRVRAATSGLAAELNATLWERRAHRLRLNTPPT